MSTGADSKHFIRQMIEDDLQAGRNGGRVVTRFPPEPNGYLHIGHAKAVCLDFGMALEYGGRCHLRMDDTNPTKESVEYVENIQRDIRWLGFDWGEHFYYSADYFERMFAVAESLIRRGKAYVCELSMEEWKDYRGVPEKPGRGSPFRDRPAEESVALFHRMRAGEFPDGSLCLRAKIDMASPNLHLRDPVLYRILRVPHYRTGDRWCLYPTYDFAHPLEDAFEGITHSLCTLEFEVHRPLYDWVVAQLEGLETRPRQYEFARLNLSYTVMSKRKLLELVQTNAVRGWDDPRMPTLCGLRRRGYPPEAIRAFCEVIGITKYESLTDVALLEHCVREHLNKSAPRVMGILKPLKVVIENYPEGAGEELEAVNNPEDPAAGTRQVPFSKVLYLERDDFMEAPPKKFFRLAPGREVRLRYAYFITCTGVVKDPVTGEVIELRCTYDPATRGGNAPDGRKVKATIHWLSAAHAVPAEIRLYDRLFLKENPADESDGLDWKTHLNPAALQVTRGFVEPGMASPAAGVCVQFERLGYFCADPDSAPGRPVFNRTATLKDTWAKIGQQEKDAAG
jgi:glutaminyl-tRNA synthetase